MNYIDNLIRELLHTPRREWKKKISLRILEAEGICYCSYCGHQHSLKGLETHQRNEVLLNHIMVCQKRPELKFVHVCLAAADAMEKFENMNMIMDDGAEDFGKAMAHLKTELDKFKEKHDA